MWREYIEYHTDEPAATFEQSKRTRRTPWVDSLKAALCRYFGYDPMTFDDVPLHQATIDYSALAELEGSATVINASISDMRRLQTVGRG